MKIRTITRLEVMAAESEAKLLAEMARHNAILGQIGYQRGVLADYRGRLSETWRSGGIVFAGQARRAEHFVLASSVAEVRIDAEEVRALGALDDLRRNLARLEERRRALAALRRKAGLAEARAIERALERDLAPRRRVGMAA